MITILEKIFSQVLDQSYRNCLLIVAVLLVRALTKKAPKWSRMLLWAIVFVGLIVPVRISSPTSIYNYVPEYYEVIGENQGQLSGQIEQTEWSGQTDKTVQVPQTQYHEIAQTSAAQTEEKQQTERLGQTGQTSVINKKLSIGKTTLRQIFFRVWTVGIGLMLLYLFVGGLSVKARVREAVYYRENIWLGDYVTSPFLFGLIRPRIYLPSGMDGQQMEYVILHERIHLKHGDHWWKLIGFLAIIIHWFNPLVWVSYLLFCKDVELVCDERVIKSFDMNEKKSYSTALLSCSVQKKIVFAMPLAFGEIGVAERIKNVLDYKKPQVWMGAAAVVGCVWVAACFLTNPKVVEDTEPETPAMDHVKESGEAAENHESEEDVSPEMSAEEIRMKEIIAASLRELSLETLNQAPCIQDVPMTKDYPGIAWIEKDEEHNVILYSYGLDHLVIRENDEYWVLEEGIGGPRIELPGLGVQDFDGDGEIEFAVTPLIGSGTGVNIVGLYVYEKTDTGLKRQELDTWEIAEEISKQVTVDYCKGEQCAYVTLRDGTPGLRYARLDFGTEDFLQPQEPFTKLEFGCIFETEIVENEFGVILSGGYLISGRFDPIYDSSVNVRAKLIYHPDGTFELGEMQFDEGAPNAFIIAENLYEQMAGNYWFLSGTGAWRTNLQLKSDGTFTGIYEDQDADTIYRCVFNGAFSMAGKMGEHTYSAKLTDLTYDTPGKRFREGRNTIITSTPYGLENAEEIRIYAPTHPVAELSEEEFIWLSAGREEFFDKRKENVNDIGLPCFAFCNVNEEMVFVQMPTQYVKENHFSETPHVVKTYEATDAEAIGEKSGASTLVRYYEMSDGTWKTDNHSYKYRLEITGRMGGAVKDSTFVYLSNVEEITFEQAWKAAGFSSNMSDYFKPEVAKFVGWQ